MTEVQLRLVRLPMLYGGSLTFDEQNFHSAFHGWAEWTRTAHPDVTTSVAITKHPDSPTVPERLRGRRSMELRFGSPGDADEGTLLAQPLRDLALLQTDELSMMPTTDTDHIHNEHPPAGASWARSMMLTELNSEAAEHLLAAIDQQTPFKRLEIRHLGNVTASDVAGGSAVGGRSGIYTVKVSSRNQPQFATVLPGAVDLFFRRLEQWRNAETNINVMGAPLSAAHFATAWSPEVFSRLADVRTHVDPDSRFATWR